MGVKERERAHRKAAIWREREGERGKEGREGD